MLIKQNECDVPRFHAICVALGTEELLGQLLRILEKEEE